MWRLVLLSSVVLVFAAAALAETYVVNPEGTGDFPTIQAAIDAAVDGDIIELADGVFRGVGNRDIEYLGKSITVRSQSGSAEACVIDCEGSPSSSHRGFLFQQHEGRGSVLEAVTVTRGYYDYWGGGICCDPGSPIIRRCILRENHAPGSEGGGLFVGAQSQPLVEGCLFDGNSAYHGGGLSICFADGGWVPEVIGCTFCWNTAQEGGGARY